MTAYFATVNAVTYVGAVPLAMAVFGIVCTARLGGAMVSRRSGHYGRLFSIASLDLIAVLVIIGLLFRIWRDGGSEIEALSLAFVTLFQVVIALTAFKGSRAISQTRDKIEKETSSKDLEPGDRRNSRYGSGVSSGAPVDTESKLMPQSKDPIVREDRGKLMELGRKRYEELLPKIGIEHKGDFIAISVLTGSFTTSPDIDELKFVEALIPGDCLWIARIGSI